MIQNVDDRWLIFNGHEGCILFHTRFVFFCKSKLLETNRAIPKVGGTMSRKAKNDASMRPETDPPPAVLQYIHDEVELDLQHKRIGDKEAKQIAKELETNTTLKYLDLGWNDVGDDGAIAFANALTVNKTLARLKLDWNCIRNAGRDALGQALIQNDSLMYLSICANWFRAGGLTSFVSALKVSKGLKELYMNCNRIDDESVVILAEVLKSNKVLTRLDLGNYSDDFGCFENTFGSEGAAALADALKTNTTLDTLFLGYCMIGDEGAMLILEALMEWNTTLAYFGMYNGLLHPVYHISEDILSAIYDVIDTNRFGIRLLGAPSQLDLSCKDINATRAKLVAKELATNSSVTSLVLSKNDIGDEGSVDIGEALTKNSTLALIDLEDNGIGDTGSSSIAAALLENTTLTKVFLNGNSIGPGGAAAIAEMLRVNTNLQFLGLGRNCIGNGGAVAIAAALRSNATITRLDLNGNGISDEGAAAILTALKQDNNTLVMLNLGDNDKISLALQKSIDFVLASRIALQLFLERLHEPLQTRCAASDRRPAFAQCHETVAGPIFQLVKTVVKGASPSRKRSREEYQRPEI
jgi:Ran GTPase-activating protein (RanGAP) involved in mRNA processing and transport